VIASHYAEPLDCRIATPTALRTAPSNDAETIRDLAAGEPFAMLDDSLGWHGAMPAKSAASVTCLTRR